MVVVAHRWKWRRLERRRRPPLLRSREGNSSCHANQWFVGFSEVAQRTGCLDSASRAPSLRSPLVSLPSVADVEEVHRAPGEITLCSGLLLVSGRRLHSADVATINILQTHAPNRSRADHIRSCGARWYVHSLNNTSQNTTSHLARLSIRRTLSCLASHLLVHSRQFGVDFTFEVGEYPDTALDRRVISSARKRSSVAIVEQGDCKE